MERGVFYIFPILQTLNENQQTAFTRKDMMDTLFPDMIDGLIRKNLPFAFYFHPWEKEPHLVAQVKGPLKEAFSCESLQGVEGFVLAPFAIGKYHPLVVIRPDIHLKGSGEVLSLAVRDIPLYPFAAASGWPKNPRPIISKSGYGTCLENVIREIRQGAFDKVVFSRTMEARIPENETPGRLFIGLKKRMDGAFVSLVHLPGGVVWLGASPETLIKKEADRCRVVSLAGTVPVNARGEGAAWTEKERREQGIVTAFIEETLQRFNIRDYEKNGPVTAPAGSVAHLKTEFTFPAASVNGNLEHFVAALHPTPAVCGLSKEKAMDYLLSHEPHDREYYGGFLGEYRLSGSVALYVNIRCMKLMGKKALLFVGGGITADSVVEKEWDETRHKAETLLSVLSASGGGDGAGLP